MSKIQKKSLNFANAKSIFYILTGREDVIEINVDEPQNDRLGSSPYRSGMILGPVLIDE